MNITENYILENSLYIPSPNCDQRPLDTEIDLLIIHGISLPPGKFGNHYIIDFFTNKLNIEADPYFTEIATLRVSSHCLIQRDGQVIQFVPFDLRAWHAGQSEFEGKAACNDYSIGIELEGTDELPYTDLQYDTLVKVTKTLQSAYPKITSNRIVGHSTIAPLRKTDPGPAFNWNKFKDALLLNV